MKLILFLLIIILILINNFKKIKELINLTELFMPIENNNNYIPITSKYCLVTKMITKEGGKYKSELKNGPLPQILDNQKVIVIDDTFTDDTCINQKFGSGRQRGGFVCMDFITEKMSKKYNLEYSDKTCYDTLDFIPIYPIYEEHLNK
ncbi:hypothetical protein crov055 [Cafeteria roenbergensis virus]|uniref:Uncharacterized protein n=1 Tax=Cafeteria roenbergensis virus (strain BV-PW1) TaxID=693272 RepID=E3T4H5_CROVB|nr:hypothetical protein crov055 [Cafeteria roenbergensis virus BV-PW1]ADO67088.1 hypothetical protein crov055 [Cafeteria roenbergensis virus BV-PW1]